MDIAQSIVCAQEACVAIKARLDAHLVDIRANLDRNAVAAAIDAVIPIGNEVSGYVKSIDALKYVVAECESLVYTAIEIQRSNLAAETRRLNESRGGKKEMWADVVDDPNVPPAWAIKKAAAAQDTKTTVPAPVAAVSEPDKPVVSGTAFSVLNKNEGETVWYRMTVPVRAYKMHPDSELTIRLITVSSDNELSQLPAGVMVYHVGKKVPKVMMTTGRSCAPAVPLGCRMYSVEDNEVYKYSRLNLHAKTSNGPGDDQFYIDELLSRQTNIDEDTTRNFRLALKGPEKRWAGYRVFKMDNFGDAKYLKEQLNKVKIEDSLDLYQYALHMMLVAILQYRHAQ